MTTSCHLCRSVTVLQSNLCFDLFRWFEAAGIELLFPQRDLHLRSSDITLPFAGPQTGGSGGGTGAPTEAV